MSTKGHIIPAIGLLTATAFFGSCLTSSFSFAIDKTSITDEVNITVPVSCSLEGTGMNTHNATIANGTYNSNIGETTMKAFCNDEEGFAIYAIGYTGDKDGINYLIDFSSDPPQFILTGTATSGGASNWAMKLSTATNPAPTYPLSIQNSFDSFHAVPDDYTLVAKRASGTDVGQLAEGSTLKSTYQAYVNQTQPAGTYTGQVKYVMVHPSLAPEPLRDDQFDVVFNGNGLTFTNGLSTNRVVYGDTCVTDSGYVGNSYQESMTPNISTGGDQDGPYPSGEPIIQPVTIAGADRLKVVIEYGLSDAMIGVITGTWDGESEPEEYEIIDGYYTGEETYIINDNSVTFILISQNEPEEGYDYGFYAKIYPVYNEETTGSTYQIFNQECTFGPQIGAYSETTTWNGYWYALVNGSPQFLNNESDVRRFLKNNSGALGGTTIELYAANTYTVIFDANGGSGTMENQAIYPYKYTTLNSPLFTYTHKDIVSWNTSADGTGESYPIIYGTDSARVYEPISGVHAGESVILYAQWGECRAGGICYDDNGANSPTGMGIQKTYLDRGLWAPNFQRPGYGFAGWNTEIDGTGTTYGPNQTPDIVQSDLSQEGVRMYAMWVPSAGSLQNWSGCSSLNTGDVTALTDLRDNNTYTVAKLADGNCWMVENLRIETEATRGDTNKILSQGYGMSSSYGNFIGLADSESTSFNGTSTVNSIYYSGTQSGTASINIGTSFYPNKRIPHYNNENTSSPQSGSTYLKANPTYSMGDYYTWSAAMANTIFYSSTTSTDASGKTSETVNTSICPAGWRLPYGRSTGNGATSGGFYYLSVQLGATSDDSVSTNKWRSYPNNFIYAGLFNSSAKNRGEYGYYWSTTASNTSTDSPTAYALRIAYNSSDILTYSIGAGYSIRCIIIPN